MSAVSVEKDERGKWWVVLDGRRVSDHRDHVAARLAAQRHIPSPSPLEGTQA